VRLTGTSGSVGQTRFHAALLQRQNSAREGKRLTNSCRFSGGNMAHDDSQYRG
jgi:hypothetical protein